MILKLVTQLGLGSTWLALVLTRSILAVCVRLIELTLAVTLGERSTTHGSLRWSSYWEILRSGALGRCGLIVGKVGWKFIRYKAEGFVLLFAPTRTGKGYLVVIPNLLEYSGSIIVIDIKGENHAITSRARAIRGPVWTLNVMDPAKSHGFNPLDMIQVGTWHEADDAKQLADLLIIPTFDGEHWDEKARALLGTILLYVCHKYAGQPELRTLANVRALAAQDWPGLEALLLDAATSASVSLREEATSLLAMEEKSDELKSIKSTVDKATSLWSIDKPRRHHLVHFGLQVRGSEQGRGNGLRHGSGGEAHDLPWISPRHHRLCPDRHDQAEAARSEEEDPVAARRGGGPRPSATDRGRGRFLATYMRMIGVWQDLDQRNGPTAGHARSSPTPAARWPSMSATSRPPACWRTASVTPPP